MMSEVTQILSAIEQGDPTAANRLLPLVYDELRKLAAAKLAREKPGQTLQPTELVHEAYLRLVGKQPSQHWNNRGHFFGAAAEAMRRIVVENARRKARIQHGGELDRVSLEHADIDTSLPPDEILAVNDLMDVLAAHDVTAAELVKLRYFAGLSVEQAAEAIGLSRSSAYRQWVYARAWLLARLRPAAADSKH